MSYINYVGTGLFNDIHCAGLLYGILGDVNSYLSGINYGITRLLESIRRYINGDLSGVNYRTAGLFNSIAGMM
jgi:hypothetical protein